MSGVCSSMPPITSQLYERITNISLTVWYVIVAVTLPGIWLFFRLAYRCWRTITQLRGVNSLKRALRIQVPELVSCLDVGTYLDGAVVVILITANVVPLALWSQSWQAVQRRAAKLAVINMAPLWTGLTFGLPADLLGIDRATLVWSHRWVGRMVAFHAFLHGFIVITTADDPKQMMRHAPAALTATGAILLVIPLSLHAVVRRYPQLAMKAHYSLAVTTMCALAYHVRNRQSGFCWYLLGSVALWIVLTVAAVTHVLFIKKRWGFPWPRLKALPCQQLLHLEITVPIHWKIQPGQYIHIWLPRSGFPSCLQLVVFYVAFWDDTNRWRTLHVVTRPQASSLAMQLDMRKSVSDGQQPALVLGPYGRPFHFPMAGTILFVVEDIGIMRVLPLIRILVQASEQRQVMVRKLEVVWQMDDFDNQRWVTSWMQQSLDLDRDEFKILQFSLFYRANSTRDSPPDRLGGRIRLSPGTVDITGLVQQHLYSRRGNMVVGVCARQFIRNKVRSLIGPKVSSELQLVDFPVEPYHALLDPNNGSAEPGGPSQSYKHEWINSRIAEGYIHTR